MKMVANFRRSLSFPNHPISAKKPKKTFHIRSTSLPCRSHPLISQLRDEINELKSFITKPEARSSAWLCSCLARVKTIHESLDDLLQLPQTRESLSTQVQFIEKVLEDFLRFIDVYGIFQTLVLTLKQEHLAAQVAVRRKDECKVALYAKGLKKITKEMNKLVSTLQPGVACPCPTHRCCSDTLLTSDTEAELADAIKDVVEVTMAVSVTLFIGVSISLPLRQDSSSWIGLALGKKLSKVRIEEGIEEFQQVGFENLWGLKKKGDEHVKMISKKMQDLEDCIVGIESGSEKVFRSLINARVSLLNVLT